MSPRFSGRQYPGAMKDHRARKRDEAAARQQQQNDVAAPGAFSAFADSFAEACNQAAKYCESVVEAFAKLDSSFQAVFQSPPTQADFVLIPGGRLPGLTLGPTTVRSDLGGALPEGFRRYRNETGQPEYVLTREEWEAIQRRARGEQ